MVGANYSIAKAKFLFLMIVQCQVNQKHIKYNNHHHLQGVIIQDHLKIKTKNPRVFVKIQQMNKTSLFKVEKVMMNKDHLRFLGFLKWQGISFWKDIMMISFIMMINTLIKIKWWLDHHWNKIKLLDYLIISSMLLKTFMVLLVFRMMRMIVFSLVGIKVLTLWIKVIFRGHIVESSCRINLIILYLRPYFLM